MKISGVKRGIQKRIVISMLIIGIVPLVVGLYLTYIDGTNTLKKTIGVNFQETAKETASRIDLIINKEVTEIRRLAISPGLISAVLAGKGDAALSGYLRQFKGFDDRNVYSLLVVNAEGDYIAGVNEVKKGNYRKEAWFSYALNSGRGKVYVGNLKANKETGLLLVNIAAPVLYGGKAAGVVVINYNIERLFEFIQNVKIGTSGHAALADSTSSILMSPAFPPLTHNIASSFVKMLAASAAPGWSVVDDDAHGGKSSLIGYAPVSLSLDDKNNWFDGNRWYVFVRQNPVEMHMPIYMLLARVLAFGLFLVAALSIAGIMAARKIVGPVNELFKVVKLAGQGKLDYRLNIKTGDEIETLADEFNNMAEELKKTYTALEERNRELKISEERYKDLVENSPEMIHSVNADRYFIDVNKTELEILGYSLQEMRNMKIDDIVPVGSRHLIKKHIDRTIREGINSVEMQFIAKDGRKIEVDISAAALYHPVNNQFVKLRAFLRDITDRKRLERHLKDYYETLAREVNDKTRELKETKDYLENLLETANDVICTLNSEGTIKYVNKKIEEWGYTKEEVVGSSFLTLLSEKYKDERFKNAVTKGIRETYEVEALDKSGAIKDIVLSVSPLRGTDGKVAEILCIANDITEQKRLEHQIAQAEKMSAIGQLAAGIAHEINNPIGGILNCLYNLRTGRLPETRVGEYLQSMEDGIRRVQRTVDQLLDFSQQHLPELTTVHINYLVRDVLSLTTYAITSKDIRLELKLGSELPLLMLDQHKMGQVVMNILLNAVHAIEGDGVIEVRTFQEDEWCCLEIKDNGTGIPAAMLTKIFDPFFTTKDVGKGTGLGLAVSLGIVEKHSGRIEVKSVEGKGASFIIKLPVNGAPVAARFVSTV